MAAKDKPTAPPAPEKAPDVTAPASPAAPAVSLEDVLARLKAAEDRAAAAETRASQAETSALEAWDAVTKVPADNTGSVTTAQTEAPPVFADPAPVTSAKPQKREVIHGYGKKLWENTPDVIYVDTEGKEWPAKVSPLPTNKYPIVKLPGVRDPHAELQKISQMDPEKQMEAFQDYQKRMGEGAPAMRIAKKYVPLMEYRGVLCLGMEINGKLIPAPDLLINMSTSDEYENWIPKHHVRPEDYVAKSPKGMHQVPYFKVPTPPAN